MKSSRIDMESEKNLLITPIKNMSHNWDYEITEWKKNKTFQATN